MRMTISGFRGMLALAAGFTLAASPLAGGTAYADGHDSVRMLATFDRCAHRACATRVPDDSGHHHAATVRAEEGGGLTVTRGRHRLGARLNHANLQIRSRKGDHTFDPGERAFAYGLFVKMDEPPPAAVGENLFQRGTYGDEPGVDQFKLQIDPGRQGCVVKGNQERVFDFAPADLPIDGRWHSVVCAVTPETISYIVDGTPYRTPNTAGPITFPRTENLQIGGNFIADTNGDPVRRPIDDAFFAVAAGHGEALPFTPPSA